MQIPSTLTLTSNVNVDVDVRLNGNEPVAVIDQR